jgi:hypothetical protein
MSGIELNDDSDGEFDAIPVEGLEFPEALDSDGDDDVAVTNQRFFVIVVVVFKVLQ